MAIQPIAGGEEGKILQVGVREEELVTAMLTDFGSWLDLDARQLQLTEEELTFIESLAPLMGGTPRRVKRFVNICQLLLAMAPPLSAEGGQPTERMATCFMAAIHEGTPYLARRLAVASADQTSNPLVTLRDALAAVAPAELVVERECVQAWLTRRQELEGSDTDQFESTPLSRFLNRYDLIRRLTFDAVT